MIHFLGNLSSFHINTWILIYKKLGLNNFDLFTIHDADELNSRFREIKHISFKSKFMSYLFLGLKLRFNSTRWVHAHGASGYGFAAWLSGKPYIATVYGSEVLAKHGFLFRLMMRTILRGSKAITVTSDATRDAIINNFGVPAANLHSFHTGIDIDALDAFGGLNPAGYEEISTKGSVVFSMRNAAPHYRTHKIIECCAELIEKGYPITLVVPLGNGDPLYFRYLQKKYPDFWIVYIDRRLENHEMLQWMKVANVCVSYPVTDQLSTTILEALYVGHAVVAGWLDAYGELEETLGDDTHLYFARNNDLSSALEFALKQHESKSASQAIENNYSIVQAAGHLSKIMRAFND